MESQRPARSRWISDRIRRLFAPETAAYADRVDVLEAECEQLRIRLREADGRGRQRAEALYNLQQQYSSEHFELQESMRNLKIERMRNAGMFGDRDIVIARSKDLQDRIQELKKRLRAYEPVEDALFDESPIVVEGDRRDQGPSKDG